MLTGDNQQNRLLKIKINLKRICGLREIPNNLLKRLIQKL